MNRADLLVRGATVLDPDGPLRQADVLVQGSIIAEVAPAIRAPGAAVIDGRDRIAMPGLINAHTHSGQNLDRGVAPNLPLDLWLIWVVYGGIAFSADDSYTLALAGALEMLESGTTAVLDHAWVSPDDFDAHADAIMSAYADAGIRAGLAPMIQDRDIFESMSFDGVPYPAPAPFSAPLDPRYLTARMVDFLDRWSEVDGRLRPMVGPSAPQRCSDELMEEMAALSRDRAVPFHTHVLETKTQVVATRERYGRSVLAHLGDLGLMTPATSLAHCVWMDATEYQAVQAAGVTIVHNPVSNLRCGSGLLPLGDLLRGGVSVALGADGAASNDNQNMFEAMKFASLIHTLYSSHQQWPTTTDVWTAGLRGGAAALGQPIGAIAPGMQADLVLLDTDRHVTVEKSSLVGSLLLAEHGESVDTVIVGGNVCVREGRSTTVDRRAANERSLALQRRIHEALPARQAVYERHAQVLDAVHERAMAEPIGIERLAGITPAFEGEVRR